MKWQLSILLLFLVSCSTQVMTVPIVNNTVPDAGAVAIVPVVKTTTPFSEYVNNPRAYQDSNLSLVGNLLSGLPDNVTTGKTQYFVVDSYGTRIRLRNYEDYMPYFYIQDNKTLYVVNGTWQKEYYGFGLYVNSISKK